MTTWSVSLIPSNPGLGTTALNPSDATLIEAFTASRAVTANFQPFPRTSDEIQVVGQGGSISVG